MTTYYCDPTISGAGGTGVIGDPWSFLSASANVSYGDTVLVKAGTNAAGWSAFNVAGVIWIGTASDWSAVDVPTVVMDRGGSTTGFTLTATHNWFRNFRFTNVSGSNDLFVPSTGGACAAFYRCKFDTSGRSLFASTTAEGWLFSGCEFSGWGSGGYGIVFSGGQSHQIYGCNFHDASSPAIRTTSTAGIFIARNLFESVAATCIEVGATTGAVRPMMVCNNTFYANTNGIEWRVNASVPCHLVNNVFQSNTGTALLNNSSQTVWIHEDRNVYNGNGTNKGGSFYTSSMPGSGWVGLAGVQLEDPANGDFRPKVTQESYDNGSPPGLMLAGVLPGGLNGMPSTNLNGIDIGAIERRISSSVRARHRLMESIRKNVASQKFYCVAVSTVTGLPVSGITVSLITCKLSKDGGATAALTDTNPTEIGDGLYAFDLTQAETNADRLVFIPTTTNPNTMLDTVEHVTISGDTTVYVTPGSAVASSIATLRGTNIEVYQDSETPAIVLGIEDADGDPIDLTGLTVRFVAWDVHLPGTIHTETDTAGGITIATATVTIDVAELDTTEAGQWSYNLWDVTNKRVLSSGMFIVREAVLGGA